MWSDILKIHNNGQAKSAWNSNIKTITCFGVFIEIFAWTSQGQVGKRKRVW